MLDRSVEIFLDDLLEFVGDGKVVPIIGEELLRVRQNGDEVPLYRYVADKLAERLEIPAASLPLEPSLNDVVCHYLQARNVPEEVYPKIRPILNQAHFVPPEPLLQLAGIDRFKLFCDADLRLAARRRDRSGPYCRPHPGAGVFS